MPVFYKTASFWTMVVTAIGSILGAIFTNFDLALYGVTGAAVIAYLVQYGILAKASLNATIAYILKTTPTPPSTVGTMFVNLLADTSDFDKKMAEAEEKLQALKLL